MRRRNVSCHKIFGLLALSYWKLYLLLLQLLSNSSFSMQFTTTTMISCSVDYLLFHFSFKNGISIAFPRLWVLQRWSSSLLEWMAILIRLSGLRNSLARYGHHQMYENATCNCRMFFFREMISQIFLVLNQPSIKACRLMVGENLIQDMCV